MATPRINDMRLLGGGRGRPKIIKPPKLRILAPCNEWLNMLVTLFRGLNNYWFLYDHHPRCQYVAEHTCIFCALQSLSQRLNQPKREKHIEPYKLNSLCRTFSDDCSEKDNTVKMVESFINHLSKSHGGFHLLEINCIENLSISQLLERELNKKGECHQFLYVFFQN